jgi:CheY-like chemotaxis protein
MKCPRCGAQVTATPDEAGFLHCASCGAKLRSRAGVSKAAPSANAGDADALLARSEVAPPTVHGSNPNATLPPGTPLPHIARPREPSRDGALLEELLHEVKAVRASQEEILRLLQAGPAALPASGEFEGFRVPPVRTRRKKTVLLIDDDLTARQAAVTAMERAEIPVRATGDGNGGVAAIAAERPDVIVIDLGLGGSLQGKDVINMIKATMEWVDIPIVLYTGVAVDGQKEARTIHGADEVVPKSAGPEALVAKVIMLFRKG